IGTGKGDYWIGMSDLYPDTLWVGIEKNESVAALAVRKSGEESENRCFIYGDAQAIDEWFAPHEVDVIHLNFSDPWPKNRTKKRRLSHPSFLKKYDTILKADGEIIMKTDNASLFEYSVLEFQENGYYLADFSVDFRRVEHDEDVISEYERKFMELGNPIYRAIWKRK
ncbi:MAG: tRNA (guanosine(46)-N7)-methyltransferase TrmB, partial [Erysipelotrichia bacterium]|nr:tRNA (guanosine(46)-N7)-methyltransferase TrmB [Erysipelotrichia bacterium]